MEVEVEEVLMMEEVGLMMVVVMEVKVVVVVEEVVLMVEEGEVLLMERVLSEVEEVGEVTQTVVRFAVQMMNARLQIRIAAILC